MVPSREFIVYSVPVFCRYRRAAGGRAQGGRRAGGQRAVTYRRTSQGTPRSDSARLSQDQLLLQKVSTGTTTAQHLPPSTSGQTRPSCRTRCNCWGCSLLEHCTAHQILSDVARPKDSTRRVFPGHTCWCRHDCVLVCLFISISRAHIMTSKLQHEQSALLTADAIDGVQQASPLIAGAGRMG